MKGVKHYKKDGSVHTGKSHKMNGTLRSGVTHTASSVRLFHYGELNQKAKTKARDGWRK
jgi:hypothetical protein|tara:strand:+ start:1001 stop:1177 length:177 start_codon:yes stop_codon:yes gene_type:complete